MSKRLDTAGEIDLIALGWRVEMEGRDEKQDVHIASSVVPGVSDFYRM
jgi:hypothetical protein